MAYPNHCADESSYLEINPLVVIPNADATSAEVHFLDLAAKLDQTAEFECGVKWAIARSPAALGIPAAPGKADGKVTIDAGPPMEFPAPFGREMSKEEAYIAEMDAKTGASLKLTILNSQGRVWTLVAGGGASVVYADAIASAGFASELANYGEYSGAPTETQTFHYARTVFDLMLRAPMHPDGKVLFIGGGIANFTNVSFTRLSPVCLQICSADIACVLGRKHIQGCHPRPARSRPPARRAQGPDLGPPCRPQLPRGSQEHQGRRAGARAQHARLRSGDARLRHRAAGAGARQDERQHQGVRGLIRWKNIREWDIYCPVGVDVSHCWSWRVYTEGAASGACWAALAL